MVRYLVTGGSGFIGTHLVDALLARGDTVANLDIAAPKKDEHRAYWHELDLMDAAGVKQLCDDFRPDVIVNLAAVADLSIPLEAMAVNWVGVENLLKATAEWPTKPRLVHTSTQLVVGAGFVADHPRDYHPYTPYGESKALSEEVLWNWPGDIEWAVIRPCLVWGSHYPGFAKATWYYLQKRWYLIPSRNSAVKTFSYVGNLVDQFIAAATLPADEVNHRIFYGGDCNLDSAVWLDAFARALTGKRARRVPYAALQAIALAGDLSGKIGGPSPINSGRLFRMTQDYPNPVEETHRALGKPRHTMEEGVASTVKWLREAYPERFA
ncbi:MAG: NAD(P)-dependent oxidoreductase [Porphyrobacter sp.]|nr:NAD(P)-dependent oxidoreductase [Porphyrobacter sp.]